MTERSKPSRSCFSGVLHTLLNLRTQGDLEGHPKVGASWGGFVLGQIIRPLGVTSDECFFWATHGGAELDLLVVGGRQRLEVKIKRTSSPRITPSMRSALSDLKLQYVDIIHAGEITFPMIKNIRAVALSRLLEDITNQPIILHAQRAPSNDENDEFHEWYRMVVHSCHSLSFVAFEPIFKLIV